MAGHTHSRNKTIGYGFFYALFLALFPGALLSSCVSFHPTENNIKAFVPPSDEIRLKQNRVKALDLRIETLQKELELEKDQQQKTYEQLWKSFLQEREAERRQVQDQRNALEVRKANFENQLENRRVEDALRVREKEGVVKNKMQDLQALDDEIERETLAAEAAPELQASLHEKHVRAEDLRREIQALHQELDMLRQEQKAALDKLSKEFFQSLDLERKNHTDKLTEIDQRQNHFEKELERQRLQDQVRIREKENVIKQLMYERQTLSLEIEQDLSDARKAHSLEKAVSASSESRFTSDDKVKVSGMSMNQVIGNSPFRADKVHQEYSISKGDILGVDVWRNPDLTRRVTVRPDGRISLPLAGDLEVVGISLVELREILTRKLSEYIQNPQVTISLEGLGGKKFVVLGEVRSPGVYRYQEEISLIEALALAGGFTEMSHKGKVMIIRGDIRKTPQVKVISANALNVLQKGMLTENLTIMPNDIIYLGKDFSGGYKDFINSVIGPSMDTALDFFVLRSAVRTAQGKRN